MRSLLKRAMGAIRYKLVRSYHSAIVFKFASRDTVFSSIYRSNYWSDGESRSGPGSTLKFTEEIRKQLPLIIARFGIKKIIDAPCSEYLWMSPVVEKTNIEYIGADIVHALIEKNKIHQSDRVHFYCADITADKLPDADLWICRDAFFHFSYNDILMSLIRFSESNIKYLLTTTHKNTSNFANLDIATGDFRLIDLFDEPFSFPATPLARFDDYIDPHPAREMCLFTREQITAVLPKLKAFVEGKK